MSKTRHSPAATTAHVQLASGEGLDAHYHDGHQITYASRGILSVTTDAGVWVTPSTRALWVPAHTVHEHRAYGPTDLHTIGLPAETNPLQLWRPAVIAVSALLRELLIAYAETPQEDGPSRRRLLAVLLDQLRASSEKPLHIPAPRDPRLAEIARRLDAQPADDPSLTEMAVRIGSSGRTISRLCRAELGMSYPQWRTQLRLHRALQLLAEDTPVSTVARRCGWATSSAFIDVFGRTLGFTPGRWRA